MNSIEDSNSTAPPHKSDRTAPGWLFVLPWSLRLIAGGGVNEVVKALIREFRNDGVFTPHLLVSTEEPEGGPTAGPEVIKPFLLNLWSPVNHEHPVRGLISFAFRLPYRCWALRRIIKRHNITVINPHFPGLYCLVFIILKRLKLFSGEIILSFHLSDVQDALAATDIEKKLWKILLRGANHIVVVSDDLGNAVLALDPAVATKMTTIYNGVDFDLFDPTERKTGNRFPVPIQGKLILSMGAFMERKGHDVLVRAFSLVASEIPDVHLLLVGQDGPELKSIRELIDKLSLRERVFIYVDVPHERVPSLFDQAELFVLASRKESFGLVVTEAAAAKVPVVCTRAEGLRELITDGITGSLVNIDDDVALANTIIDVLRHPVKAQRMAEALYEQVKNNMTWQDAYIRYVRVAADPVFINNAKVSTTRL